jgi:hypothetical protein
MPQAEFETAIPERGRPQTHALDRAATEIGEVSVYVKIIWMGTSGNRILTCALHPSGCRHDAMSNFTKK